MATQRLVQQPKVDSNHPVELYLAWAKNAKEKTGRLAALFPGHEIPDWAWEAKTPCDLHDQMLRHGFGHNLVSGEYEKGT